MTKKHLNDLDDHTLRIERILHIGGMSTDMSLASNLEDFFEDFEFDNDFEFFGDVPERIADLLDENAFPEAFVDWLHDKRQTGHLVEFATPVMRHLSGGSNAYSWGHCYTRWFYADTVEGTIPQATDWADGIRRGEKAKS